MPFDKDNAWKPNAKQAKFLSLPITIKEALYGGGAGSGKSEVLLMYPIVHGWHENSRFKQVFMRRTFPELRNEIVPRSREIYTRFGAVFNKADMVWTFPRVDQYGSGFNPDGAVIYLGHCENEDDVHKYDSMEINLFTPDEVTSFLEYQYLYIAFTRVRSSIDSGLPALIRAAGMPGGIGHTWVKKRFVDPAPKGGKIIVGRGNNKRVYIHSTQADNPNIDPNYSQSLEALPEAEKQAKKYGSWDAYLGQVFEEFRDKRYPDEPENALHVIEPFEIPPYWPKIVCIDWGYSDAAMTYVCYGAVSPDKRIYIYREQHWYKVPPERWGGYVRDYIDVEAPKVVKVCKSAADSRGSEHTIQQQISIAINYPVALANNNANTRVATKTLLHEYLRWKQKYVAKKKFEEYSDEKAAWLLRNDYKAYKNYLDSFKGHEEETNLPKLQIFNECTLLINAIKACSYDKNHPDDVAEFVGDDPYDTIRYVVDAAERYFGEAEGEMNRIVQTEGIIQQFNKTKDWNFLYRNAKKLDGDEIEGPVRRYRH